MLNKHFGSSIVELTSVVAIVAVLVSGAVPAVEGYYDKKRLVAAAEMVYSQLQKARSEAIARSEDVYVEFNSDGGENWAVGLSASSGCNPDHLLEDGWPGSPLILIQRSSTMCGVPARPVA